MEYVAAIRSVLQGSDALEAKAAKRLWGAIVDGSLGELELGSLLGAWAVRGESPESLCALHAAVSERLERPLLAVGRGTLVIPAYGAAPGESAYVALTAALLRRHGVPVMVHGVIESACGISTACVLRELGTLPASSIAQAEEGLGRTGIAFVPAGLVSPALARLVSLRDRLGVTNAAHLVAPLLDPTSGGAVRLAIDVRDGGGGRLDSLAARVGGEFVSLRWATIGNVFNVHARPRVERLKDGRGEPLFEADARVMRPGSVERFGTARELAHWIAEVASGAVPLPVPMGNVLAACLYALGYARGIGEAKAMVAIGAACA